MPTYLPMHRTAVVNLGSLIHNTDGPQRPDWTLMAGIIRDAATEALNGTGYVCIDRARVERLREYVAARRELDRRGPPELNKFDPSYRALERRTWDAAAALLPTDTDPLEG